MNVFWHVFALVDTHAQYRQNERREIPKIKRKTNAVYSWASAEIFSGRGKVDILLIFFWLLAMQSKLTYAKMKMSNVTATVAYSVFLVGELYTEQIFVLVIMDILWLS